MVEIINRNRNIKKCCEQKTIALYIITYNKDKRNVSQKRINKRICMKCDKVYDEGD